MLYFPKINPVYFQQIVAGDNLPKDLGQQYYGVDYPSICHKWPASTSLSIIFYSDVAQPTVTFFNDQFPLGQAVQYSNITPGGWAGVGSYVFTFNYGSAANGDIFWFTADDGTYNFESERLLTVDETDDLIKIEYQNSTNDFGYINNGEFSYFKTYLYAEDANVTPGNELISFQNDRGELTKLKATPVEGYELSVYYADIPIVNRLNMIFSCDDILVNGQPYQTNENIAPERIENSDLSKVTISLQRKEDNYMYFTQS